MDFRHGLKFALVLMPFNAGINWESYLSAGAKNIHFFKFFFGVYYWWVDDFNLYYFLKFYYNFFSLRRIRGDDCWATNSTHVGEIKGSQLKEIEEEKSEEDKEITVEIFNESSKIDKKSSSENESEKTIVKNKIQIDKIAEKSQKNIEIKYKNDDDIKDQILPIEMLQDDEEAKNVRI